jgi:hypothetical protein
MSTPPLVIERFLDRVANALTSQERRKLMPGIRSGFDELWESGDEDPRAQNYCDQLLMLAKATGGEFPALFAEAARLVETLDRCREWRI